MAPGVVFTQVFILFVIVGIGYLVGKLKILSDNAANDISTLIMNVALPMTVLQSLIREFDARLIRDGVFCIILGAVLTIIYTLINIPLGKLLRVSKERRGVWTFSSTFFNAGLMGFPVSEALFGADGIFFAAMIVVSANITSYTIGVAMMLKDSTEKKKMSLKTIFLSGVNVATAIGLVLFIGQIPVPKPAVTIINYLASTATPLAMLLTGLRIAKNRLSEVLRDKDVFTSAGVRLVLLPIITYFILKFIPLEMGETAKNTLLLVTAMPSPAITMVLAGQYKADTYYAGKAVCISTLFSVITIPLVMLLA